MDARLVSVTVTVRIKGRRVRLGVVAEGVRQAVEMAGALDDGGKARLEFPIDGDRFFVGGGRRASRGIRVEDTGGDARDVARGGASLPEAAGQPLLDVGRSRPGA